MMSLLLGHRPDAIHKIKCLLEIRESVGARNVMLVDHFPVRPFRNLFVNRCEFLAVERRHTSATGNTCLAGQVGHRQPHSSEGNVFIADGRRSCRFRFRGTLIKPAARGSSARTSAGFIAATTLAASTE